MKPKRIQRQRTKGWRMPEGAVYVGRPSKWGNRWHVRKARRSWLDQAARTHPFDVVDPIERTYLGTFVSEERATYWAVQGYRRDLGELVDDVDALRDRDLACWCGLCPVHVDGRPFDVVCSDCQPCHADVLLELANR